MMREETDEEIVREAIWSELSRPDSRAGERALAALDRLVAERDALKEQFWQQRHEWAAATGKNQEIIAAALARAEGAEKEAEMYRREAAHARTLASGWAEANAERSRAEAAEKERDEALEWADQQVKRGDDEQAGRKAAEARCATLEAALREMPDAVRELTHAYHDVVTFTGRERVLEAMRRGDSARDRLFAIEDAARAALAAATPPAECDGSGECKAQTHTHGCYSDRGNCDQPTEHVMGRRVRAALDGL